MRSPGAAGALQGALEELAKAVRQLGGGPIKVTISKNALKVYNHEVQAFSKPVMPTAKVTLQVGHLHEEGIVHLAAFEEGARHG
jgi:hypothetical protein